jgi:(p)ppGpp synthase/HD superfamily hydrolase
LLHEVEVEKAIFILIFISAVEVPGCDPYREYLFNYLRDQPIWHTLRFWNAALFYALQKDKVPKTNMEKCSSTLQLKNVGDEAASAVAKDALTIKQSSRSISESSLSSSSSSTDNTKSSESSKYKSNPSSKRGIRSRSSTYAAGGDDNTFDVHQDEKKLQDNMAFSHLG